MRPRSLPRAAIAAFVVFGSACPGHGGGGTTGPARKQLAPWTAAVDTTGIASADAVACAEDGRVAAVFQAAAAASIGGKELTSPVGGAAVAMIAAGGEVAWTRALGAKPSAVAIAGKQVVIGVGGTGTLKADQLEIPLRGQPGAGLVSLSAANGEAGWVTSVGATEWSVIRAVAAVGDGEVIAVGSFSGTLRGGDHVVSSAGASDGFAMRVARDGEVRWLMRIGGEYADAISSVAIAPEGAVVGGTFTSVADARGVPLLPIDPESISPDGFVARLDGDGGVMWAQAFGGDSDDAVAGVAVTADGTFAVAATLRGTAYVDDKTVTTRGLADAALITYDGGGHRRAVALIGGDDYDTAAALAPLGGDLVMAASYSGTVFLGDTRLDGAGGDGSLIAVLDHAGAIVRVHDVAGDGRETVAALAACSGGWAAALRHTAGATLDDATLPAPADPYGGAAIAFRGE